MYRRQLIHLGVLLYSARDKIELAIVRLFLARLFAHFPIFDFLHHSITLDQIQRVKEILILDKIISKSFFLSFFCCLGWWYSFGACTRMCNSYMCSSTTSHYIVIFGCLYLSYTTIVSYKWTRSSIEKLKIKLVCWHYRLFGWCMLTHIYFVSRFGMVGQNNIYAMTT